MHRRVLCFQTFAKTVIVWCSHKFSHLKQTNDSQPLKSSFKSHVISWSGDRNCHCQCPNDASSFSQPLEYFLSLWIHKFSQILFDPVCTYSRKWCIVDSTCTYLSQYSTWRANVLSFNTSFFLQFPEKCENQAIKLKLALKPLTFEKNYGGDYSKSRMSLVLYGRVWTTRSNEKMSRVA